MTRCRLGSRSYSRASDGSAETIGLTAAAVQLLDQTALFHLVNKTHVAESAWVCGLGARVAR